MSNKTQQEIDNELNAPATVKFALDIAQAMETRIDYNFNSIVQVSLLVEFLYESLEKQGIKIPLDGEFQEFQESRLEEIRSKFDEAVTEATEEVAKETEEELADQINLEDD